MVSSVDETGLTSTFTGFFRIVFDSATILFGIVAEKKVIVFGKVESL